MDFFHSMTCKLTWFSLELLLHFFKIQHQNCTCICFYLKIKGFLPRTNRKKHTGRSVHSQIRAFVGGEQRMPGHWPCSCAARNKILGLVMVRKCFSEYYQKVKLMPIIS